MKRSIVLILLLPVLAWAAQSPFDGTWKVNLSKIQFPEKPQVWVLQDGMYICSTCVPKINIKADGTDQPVPEARTYDTQAVNVVDAKTVMTTNKKGGKVVGSSKAVVSDDGKTISVEFTGYPEASKQPVTGKITMVRVAAGPSGSHAFSGSWRMQKADRVSENALKVTYKSSPDGLMMSDPIGESYDAKFDGKDYPVKGATAGYTVSLMKVNDRSIEETVKRDGKVVSVNLMTVSQDGKTLSIKSENKEQDTTTTFIATKE